MMSIKLQFFLLLPESPCKARKEEKERKTYPCKRGNKFYRSCSKSPYCVLHIVYSDGADRGRELREGDKEAKLLLIQQLNHWQNNIQKVLLIYFIFSMCSAVLKQGWCSCH